MRILRGLVVAGLAFGASGVAVGRIEAQRLPGAVRPEKYSLEITPNLKTASFAGNERIELVLDAPTNAITLNAAEIEFGVVKAFVQPLAVGTQDKGKASTATSSSTSNNPMKAGQVAEVSLDAATEQATLRFAQALPAGRIWLEIAYKGILNDKLRGFYLSKTKARSYGVTQFEATDARRAFPSFDEPALKSVFDVTLVVDAGDTAISNTQIISDTAGPIEGKHTIVFAETPRMSTYLVAWLVGDFKCSKGKADGIAIRVCSTPDKQELTQFALDSAKETLHYYDQYFGIKYPIAKLDLVAIPDFEAGAMENYGCITFRETALLVDKKDGSQAEKQEVAETVAHEMAHQWFGDLVTPVWWDNLWLNEGFATWMESKATAKAHPKWKIEQDVATDTNRTLDADSERTTRTIRAAAETPAEINEMFDGIAYGKAGAVLGMVENWIGEAVFQRGVQTYLAEHAYGNTTAEDFWGTMTRVSGKPVDKVMQSFVEQPGVPVVTLGSAVGEKIPVAQRRFFLATPGKNIPESSTGASAAWTIPVCFKGAGCKLLTPETAAIDASGTSFYANAGDKGYYRTNYSAEQLAKIEARAETELSVPERIGLLGDQWALMQAGQGSVGEFLDLTLAVKTDPNAAVLDSALRKIGSIETRIATDTDRDRLNKVIRREFGGVYAALGKGGWHEADEHEELRETLFEALGKAEDPVVLAEAANLAKDLFAGHKPKDMALGDAAVSLVVAKGDKATYEKLLHVAQSATDPGLKQDALHTLTRFQAPELVTRTLELAVSDEVRNQDSWSLIALLLARRETQDQAWAYVQNNWEAIARRSTENSGPRIVEATGAFCTAQRRDEVASFFATHTVPSAQRALPKAIDSINDCIQLRAEQEPKLNQWLESHAQ